ncbi:MAG: heparinase II/III family protein [Opitutaceae bacterium]|nr:heparinase II/III family protein [Opitutaceae bacterium]
MDAGTFVFELNGVRWVVDPGNQDYEPLNKIGFPLSDYSQQSERWSLLTKSNRGHSTVLVNQARFKVTAPAPISELTSGDQPSATIDLSAALNGEVKSWQRRFVVEGPQAIRIEDEFEANERTREIVWQLITVADVLPEKDGVRLRQGGKELRLSFRAPQGLPVTVVSLDPPPLKLDKPIERLKRIEVTVPPAAWSGGKGRLEVRLSGQ